MRPRANPNPKLEPSPRPNPRPRPNPDAKVGLAPPASAEERRGFRSRGLGGVSIPACIAHSWVPCATPAEKPRLAAAVLDALAPPRALLFLQDDAPLHATIAELRAAGVDAVALHEAMGLADGRVARRGELSALQPLQPLSGPPTQPDARPADGAGTEAAGGGACRTRLLVSTTGSARGLDLPVDCVLLYSLPDGADEYTHLAGRTGRQGRAGSVVSLLAPDEQSRLGGITRQTGISIKQNAAVAVALAAAPEG